MLVSLLQSITTSSFAPGVASVVFTICRTAGTMATVLRCCERLMMTFRPAPLQPTSYSPASRVMLPTVIGRPIVTDFLLVEAAKASEAVAAANATATARDLGFIPFSFHLCWRVLKVLRTPCGAFGERGQREPLLRR